MPGSDSTSTPIPLGSPGAGEIIEAGAAPPSAARGIRARGRRQARTTALAGLAALLAAAPAAALDGFEIQVYDGQANAPWDTSLEVHLNHVLQDEVPAQFDGQAPQGHITHATFEFALGVTRFLELGAYVQTAMPVHPTVQPAFGGAKLRTKFVVPHDITGPWRLGANLEGAYVPARFDDNRWGGELRPILGYKSSRLVAIFNPIVELNLGALADSTFAPAAKVGAVVWGPWALGAEYYAGAPPTNEPGDLSLREQYAYLAADLFDRPLELNVAVGHGLTRQSRGWVVKLILGFPLG